MISNCQLCGREEKLVEAISSNEIVEICEKCAIKNSFPIIKKPTIEQIRKESRFYSPNTKSIVLPKKRFDPETEKVNNELKSIVAANIKKGSYDDLVDNFHWKIQQGRRMRKLSQKQLGEHIAEPEIIISMAEKGELPENYSKFIIKLEQYLGVQLRKNPDKRFSKELDIKKIDLSSVTTSDLKKMSEFKEEPTNLNLK
ncbi:MAG: hypothetical protein QXI33_02535 [Candidatus Pacearchaeota archaeon]